MRNSYGLGILLALALPVAAVAGEDPAKQHDDHMVTLKTAAAPGPLDVAGGTPVEYTRVGDKAVVGTLFRAAKPLAGAPGVVLIHEWWGLNDQVRAKAKELAAVGFHALAVDLYAGQSASEPEGAKKLATAARGDLPGVVKNLADAVAWLKRETKCARVGSLGWCLGGGFSLELGLARPDEVAAVVMYYGQVKTTAEAVAPLKAPLMGLFGGLDQGIPVADVRAFKKLLKDRPAETRVVVYKDAGHAFANPTRMETYRAEDAADAWRRTLGFLRRTLVVKAGPAPQR